MTENYKIQAPCNNNRILQVRIKRKGIKTDTWFYFDMHITLVHAFQGGPHPVHKGFAESVNAKLHHYNHLNLKRVSITAPILDKINSYYIPRSDILICESTEALPTCIHAKKRMDCKVVLILADPLFLNLEKMNPIYKNYILWALRNADGIITVSEMQKANIVKYFKKKVRLVYPFFDTGRIDGATADLNSRNILFIGPLTEHKGVDIMIKTFELLKQETPECELYLVGPNHMQEKLKQVKTPGLHVEGVQLGINKYLRKCSIYLHPARYDPFGVAVIEAMAAGLVPIVSENTGAKEFVEKVSEELVLENKPELYADKILSLFLDPKKMAAYSKKCKKIAFGITKEGQQKKFKAAFLDIIGCDK